MTKVVPFPKLALRSEAFQIDAAIEAQTEEEAFFDCCLRGDGRYGMRLAIDVGIERIGGCEVRVEPISERAVVIAGGGPTGLMLAGELALARVDVAIVERRASQDLTGSRAGGLHSRTIEVFDQRGIADRFLSQGEVAQVAGFSHPL